MRESNSLHFSASVQFESDQRRTGRRKGENLAFRLRHRSLALYLWIYRSFCVPSSLRARPFPLPVHAGGRHRLTPFAGYSIQFGSERRAPKIKLMIKSIEFARQSGKLEVAQRFQFIVSSGAPKSSGSAGRGEARMANELLRSVEFVPSHRFRAESGLPLLVSSPYRCHLPDIVRSVSSPTRCPPRARVPVRAHLRCGRLRRVHSPQSFRRCSLSYCFCANYGERNKEIRSSSIRIWGKRARYVRPDSVVVTPKVAAIIIVTRSERPRTPRARHSTRKRRNKASAKLKYAIGKESGGER